MKFFIFTFLIFSSVFVFAQVHLTDEQKYSGEMLAFINANKRRDAEIANKKQIEKQQAAIDESLAGAIRLRDRQNSDFEDNNVEQVILSKDLKFTFPGRCNTVSIQINKDPGLLKDSWSFRAIDKDGKAFTLPIQSIGLPEKNFIADLLKIRNLSAVNSSTCFDESFWAARGRYIRRLNDEYEQKAALKKLDEQRERRDKRQSSASKVD